MLRQVSCAFIYDTVLSFLLILEKLERKNVAKSYSGYFSSECSFQLHECGVPFPLACCPNSSSAIMQNNNNNNCNENYISLAKEV